MTQDRRHASLGELCGDLSQDLRLLVTQTVGLATAEARATASAIALTLAGIAGAALVGLFGVLVLIASLVLIVIALGLPAWAASLLVGVLLAVTGLATARGFLTRLRRLRLDLHETRASVAETIRWLKTQTTK